jgi:hypothetical protein
MIDLVVSVEIWLGIETFWECHKSVIFVRHSIILPICTVDVETQALRQLKINHNLLSINVHYNRCAYLTHQREEGNLRPRRWGNPQTSGPGGKPADLRGNSQPQEKSSAAGEGKPSTTGGGPQTTGEGKPSITGETLRQQEKFSAPAFVNHLSTWQLPNHMPRHIESVLTCLGIKIPSFAKSKK